MFRVPVDAVVEVRLIGVRESAPKELGHHHQIALCGRTVLALRAGRADPDEQECDENSYQKSINQLVTPV